MGEEIIEFDGIRDTMRDFEVGVRNNSV